jgi:hypothetical protein
LCWTVDYYNTAGRITLKLMMGVLDNKVWKGNMRIEHGKCHRRLKKITSDGQCILYTARNIVMTTYGKFTGQAMYVIIGCGKLVLKTGNKQNSE